jgi:hypothetical protein
MVSSGRPGRWPKRLAFAIRYCAVGCNNVGATGRRVSAVNPFKVTNTAVSTDQL